jgi:glycosyltransferase involved in cell wall biosynthesis
MKTVSAIVPVYNEEKTVGRVIKVLLKSPLVSEVIAVNDGSTDNSLKILKGFGEKIKLIKLKKNKGKGWALAEGVKQAQGQLVLFVDADLVNFNERYITKILEPIFKNQWRAVVGFRQLGRMLPSVFARLSGERAYFRHDLVPHLRKMRRTRFGVEVLLNHLFEEKPVKKVALLKLKGLYKYEKRPAGLALREYLDEGTEIARQLAKQEGLVLADLRMIMKLRQSSNLNELREQVGKITNKKIRQYLEKYILAYLERAKAWWEKQEV